MGKEEAEGDQGKEILKVVCGSFLLGREENVHASGFLRSEERGQETFANSCCSNWEWLCGFCRRGLSLSIHK